MRNRRRYRRYWRRLKDAPRRLYYGLTWFGKIVVSPLDKISSAAADRIYAFGDSFKRVEVLARQLGRCLSWPFKASLNLASIFVAAVVPGAVRRKLTKSNSRLARLGRQLRRGFVRVAGGLNLDRRILRVVKFTRPVWSPFAAIIGFSRAWIKSRRYKRLLWGLPALILLLPLPLIAGWMMFRGNASNAARYRLAVNDARTHKDYARLQLFERKLAQLGADTKVFEFNSAQLLARDGKIAEAYERMQRLAPLDAPGFPPAHFWIIEHLITRKLEVSATESQRLIGIHTEALALLGIKGSELDVIRAVWLSQENKPEEAVELLKPLLYRNRLAAIERFRLDLMLKRRADARQDALAIREHMEGQGRTADSLSSNDYQWWATAEQVLGNEMRFRTIVHDWLKRYPDNATARGRNAAIQLRAFNEILQSAEPDPKELAVRIREAFSATEVPENTKQLIATLYQNKSTRRELDLLFNQLASSKDLAPSLAEILGTAAAVAGEWEQAEMWLQQAVAGDRINAVAWNNLACVQLQRAHAPLDTALSASNRAIELDAKDFRFRQTRGQILLRLGRYQEAVTDLEYALNGMPDVPTIHDALAKAYDALGNKTLAVMHRQNAN